MNRQIFYLLTSMVILVEFIQLSNTHRLVKIRKFYRPNKPWRQKIQRNLPSYVPPSYIFKKKPSWKSRYHPQHYRPIHSSHLTTIEIEFPKNIEDNDWLNSENLWTNHKFYNSDLQLINADNKNWMKNTNKKLRIKISRNDKSENNEAFISVLSDINQANAYDGRQISIDQMKSLEPILYHNWNGG